MKWSKTYIYLGFITWLLILFKWTPFSVYSLTQVQILLLAAPLYLVPIICKLDATPRWGILLSFPFAFLFSLSFFIEQGYLSALLTIPWLILCIVLTFHHLNLWLNKIDFSISIIAHLAAYAYLPVGGAWAFADRLDFQPMDFDPTIVILTAVHFHYAGFILPILYCWLSKKIANPLMNVIGILVILGIPFVAIGITTSQLNLPAWIEALGVIIMVGGALGVAFLHLYIGWKNKRKLYGFLWICCGIALTSGMILALSYGLRSFIPLPAFITIPWMYAVHGTLNAIGFALPGLLAWQLYFREGNN